MQRTAQLFATVLLAIILFTTAVQAAGLSSEILLFSHTASRGGDVAVSVKLTNQSTAKIKADSTITFTDSCGVATELGSTTVMLDGGRAIFLSLSFMVPTGACSGDGAVTVSSKTNKKLVSSATAVLSIS